MNIAVQPEIHRSAARSLAERAADLLLLCLETKGSEEGSSAVTSFNVDVDRTDITEALDGNQRAFERIVQRYQNAMAHRLRRFSSDPLVIEELVQETFVQAYFSLKKYRFEAPFEHWLHRLAIRAGYQYWRTRTKRHGPTSLREPSATLPDDPGEELEKILRLLGPRDRLVVTLLYLEERTIEQTASLTGWSRTMVKVQAFRARRTLRALLSQSNERGGHA